MADIRKQGDFLQADFFNNVGGLNTTDSPFRVQDTQAIQGYNYDYLYTGGFRKRFANTLLNSTPDSLTRTIGVGIYTDTSNSKTVLRATSTKLQTVNQSTGATTVITDDTVSAGTTPFSSTQPVVVSAFNSSSNNTTWMAGGGLSSGTIIGYNGTTYTINGAAPLAGAISVASGGAGSTTLSTNTYYYAVVAYKASTGATSNAALDVSYSSTAGNFADVQLNGITAYDTTKYTQIWIYRSSAGGTTAFTTGDLVAKIAYNGTTYTVASGSGSIVSTSKYRDNGSYISTSTNVPRAGGTSLDNSVLPSGTYNCITTYRRRLVAATGTTLYFSDLNKPESWPAANTITIPSGGPITGLAVINFNTPTTSGANEFLAVFQERQLWLITGSTFTTLTSGNVVLQTADIQLLFVDYVGCPAHNLIVNANGFLFWIDYRGVYLWDGSNKPIYASRLIEYDFGPDGDFDLTNIQYGTGTFYRKQNEVVWFLSSKTYGVNLMALKMDLRLSLANIETALAGRILEAVFIKDTFPNSVYGASSVIISSAETLFASGDDGYIWKMYDNLNSDNATGVQFSYRTRPNDMGMMGTTKRYHKVIAWCQEGNLNNLTLNFWTNYRTLDTYKSTVSEQITSQVSAAIWDQSTWDVSYWDQIAKTYNPVVFNLSSGDMGTEGEAITLEFIQNNVQSPVTIAGYSIIFSVAGLRE
jgi:hypothetical protein